MTELEIPTIETDRLRLEPLSRAHAAGMFALWSEPEVCRYAGDASDSAGEPIALPAASVTESDRLLAFWIDRARAGTGFRWAVMLAADERFVGAVGFNALGSNAEYAYHFDPRFWGGGFATEASRAALEWVFGAGSESVEVFIEAANSRSSRLAGNLGFRRSGRSADGAAHYELEKADYSHVSLRRSTVC